MRIQEPHNVRSQYLLASLACMLLLCPLATSAQKSLRGGGSPTLSQQGTRASAMSAMVRPTAAGASYPFPARAQDLKPGEYWYLKGAHDDGVQRLAYDLTAVRFDSSEKVWTEVKAGKKGVRCVDAAANQDCIVYGEPVYAMADGEVVRCWRNAPENPVPGESHPGRLSEPPTIPGGGNALWVDHGNGVFALYAHFQPGTIPASLCPIEEQFIKESADADLPAGNRPRVKKGQMIGRVGNSGSSKNPHLHVHLQKTLPNTGASNDALPLPFHGAWAKSTVKLQDSPADWVRLQGQALSSPHTAVLPDYSNGFSEIARHGVPASEYQFTVNHITGSGYYPRWVDGYEIKGKNYFNAIFSPGDGTAWVARHGLSGAQYQTEFNLRIGQGYRPLQVESYSDGNAIRYAVIFVKKSGPLFNAYHGKSARQHQALFDSFIKEGFRPINISVVSINGAVSYTALYEKASIGSFEARSFLTASEYQATFDQNKKAGRQLAYLNACNHAGSVRFSAIWNSATSGAYAARHGLSSSQYHSEWQKWTKLGYLTRLVTGYDAGNGAGFAGVWRK